MATARISLISSYTVIYAIDTLTLNVGAVPNLFEVDGDNHDVYFVSSGHDSATHKNLNSVIHQVDVKSMTVKYSKKTELYSGHLKDTMVVKDKNQVIITMSDQDPAGSRNFICLIRMDNSNSAACFEHYFLSINSMLVYDHQNLFMSTNERNGIYNDELSYRKFTDIDLNEMENQFGNLAHEGSVIMTKNQWNISHSRAEYDYRYVYSLSTLTYD